MKLTKFSTHSAHSENCYFHFFYWLSADWVDIFWGFMKFFSNRCWKFQFSILLNKNVLFLKELGFRPLKISKQKSFVYWPTFQQQFWSIVERNSFDSKQPLCQSPSQSAPNNLVSDFCTPYLGPDFFKFLHSKNIWSTR